MNHVSIPAPAWGGPTTAPDRHRWDPQRSTGLGRAAGKINGAEQPPNSSLDGRGDGNSRGCHPLRSRRTGQHRSSRATGDRDPGWSSAWLVGVVDPAPSAPKINRTEQPSNSSLGGADDRNGRACYPLCSRQTGQRRGSRTAGDRNLGRPAAWLLSVVDLALPTLKINHTKQPPISSLDGGGDENGHASHPPRSQQTRQHQDGRTAGDRNPSRPLTWPVGVIDPAPPALKINHTEQPPNSSLDGRGDENGRASHPLRSRQSGQRRDGRTVGDQDPGRPAAWLADVVDLAPSAPKINRTEQPPVSRLGGTGDEGGWVRQPFCRWRSPKATSR